MTEEIKINFEMLGGFGLLTTKIPSQMVTSLNQYIDMHVIEENNSMNFYQWKKNKTSFNQNFKDQTLC